MRIFFQRIKLGVGKERTFTHCPSIEAEKHQIFMIPYLLSNHRDDQTNKIESERLIRFYKLNIGNFLRTFILRRRFMETTV